MTAVGLGDLKVITMHVNRVMAHRSQVNQPDANVITELCHHWFGGGKCFCIKRENVEVGHLIWIGPLRTDDQLPFVRHEHEIAIRPRTFGIARMNDEWPDGAERHLRHLIMMRVIHLGAVLAQRELIFEGLTRLDDFLC